MTDLRTRSGMDGTGDKLALIEAEIVRNSKRPEVDRLAREVCRHVGNRSDDVVCAIERWCRKRPYRLEPDDVLRDPLDTAARGGDCDDLVILAGAMIRALGIPCRPQCLAHPDGNAFHVRLLVALPPGRPAAWYIVDPVTTSERDWHLAGLDVRGLTRAEV